MDFELALQSVVERSGSTLHIPMIDFETADEAQVRRFEPVLQSAFYCFATGRSFHGYFAELLTTENWIDFLGAMLLINSPNSQPVVDSRWIGHALRRGYSALRWTRHTNRYETLPSLLFSKQPGSRNDPKPFQESLP